MAWGGLREGLGKEPRALLPSCSHSPTGISAAPARGLAYGYMSASTDSPAVNYWKRLPRAPTTRPPLSLGGP